MISLKFKKLHPNAVVPQYQTAGAAGLDLVAVSSGYMTGNNVLIYETGLAVEIPEGHVGLLFPRSSVYKMDQQLANCVGVIDSDYRGEIKLIFKPTKKSGNLYRVGDRVGQLVIVELPKVIIEEVSELNETVRGSGGFGSTGK
jgi:dUTP pyrophosphatase